MKTSLAEGACGDHHALNQQTHSFLTFTADWLVGLLQAKNIRAFKTGAFKPNSEWTVICAERKIDDSRNLGAKCLVLVRRLAVRATLMLVSKELEVIYVHKVKKKFWPEPE